MICYDLHILNYRGMKIYIMLMIGVYIHIAIPRSQWFFSYMIYVVIVNGIRSNDIEKCLIIPLYNGSYEQDVWPSSDAFHARTLQHRHQYCLYYPQQEQIRHPGLLTPWFLMTYYHMVSWSVYSVLVSIMLQFRSQSKFAGNHSSYRWYLMGSSLPFAVLWSPSRCV